MWKKLALPLLCLVFAGSLFLPTLRGESPFDLGLDLAGGAMVTYRPDLDTVPERYADVPAAELLDLAKETLAGRLAQRFDTLPDVVVRADGRLVVNLPGEHDQRRVLEALGQTYRLTFRPVLATHGAPPTDAREATHFYQGRYLELGPELLDGDMLDPRSIRVDTAGAGTLEGLGQGAAVTFEFRPPHDETFARVTRDLVGETLAILLDDEIEWAGRIESEIRGPGLLRGGYTAQEAAEVAGLLRSGNLPFSLEIESLTGVGPTLGQEMSSRGLSALAGSLGLLALLLLLAYGHRPALLLTSWASLACLLLSTLGMIAVFDLTVDLVALAGLVLSIGMGMDAFILVFEALEGGRFDPARSPLGRLREVYGFRGEGRTLVHANATTLLVVLLLFLPDRLASFALFLVVGLAASLLTLFVTRGLLAFFARRGWLEDEPRELRFHPLDRLRRARPGAVRARRAYFALLAVFLLGAAIWLQVERPGAWLELGADFRPGTQLQVTVPEDRPIEPLVDALRAEHPDLGVRFQTWEAPPASEGVGYLVTIDDTLASAPQKLAEWLESREATLHGLHAIDARLSGKRMLSSLSVLLGSFVLLGLYLRQAQPRIDAMLTSDERSISAGGRVFVGTVLAVLLDVVVVLAALALLDILLGMPVLAALLTIVGYSVNDSMVLWSHLSRSEGAGDERPSIREGVDRILSRTVLTSLSTMIPAITILAADLEPLRGFAWAVLVGTLAGTLSSIFVVASFVSTGDESKGGSLVRARSMG